MDPLFIALLVALGAGVIVAVSALAPRAGVSAPLILVLLGVAVSFLPFVPAVEVPPDLILVAVLPPLLYSGSALLPTTDLRRDLRAVGSLSVLLVIITAVALGFLFYVLLPDLSLAASIALGAVVSPTDAVATWIARRMGAPPRLTVILEGEGLLNDATALTTLRAAIAATAASVSLWQMAGSFLWALAGAAVVGAVVSRLALHVRRGIHSPSMSTAVSLLVPFAAYLAAEGLGSSGLVAVVTAGLVTGYGSAIHLTAQDRASEHSNWRTVELLLEGAAFLLMGLALFGIVEDVQAERAGSVWLAAGIAALAMVALVVVRAAFIVPLLYHLRRRAARLTAGSEAVARIVERDRANLLDKVHPRWLHRFERRRDHDLAYLRDKPFRRQEGALLIFSGMRGVTTVVAAQTLPTTFPYRSTLVLIAFFVAAGTLLIQGGTLPWVIRRLGLADQDEVSAQGAALVHQIVGAIGEDLLTDDGLTREDGSAYDLDVVARAYAAVVVHQPDPEDVTDVDAENAEATRSDHAQQYRELRMRVIRAQRRALLQARASGAHDSRQIEHALAVLDAQEINLDTAYPPLRPTE